MTLSSYQVWKSQMEKEYGAILYSPKSSSSGGH